jgi:hypothetical protein
VQWQDLCVNEVWPKVLNHLNHSIHVPTKGDKRLDRLNDVKSLSSMAHHTPFFPANLNHPFNFCGTPTLYISVSQTGCRDTFLCRQSDQIRSDQTSTAPLHNTTNYLYTYLIRLLPHSSSPLPLLSLSPIRLFCPGVNPNPDPYTLLNFSNVSPKKLLNHSKDLQQYHSKGVPQIT